MITVFCYLDFGQQIKARCKADQTFLIQLACDALGYLPTEKSEKGAGYGSFVSSGKTGHEGGDLLVAQTLETLNELWEDAQ